MICSCDSDDNRWSYINTIAQQQYPSDKGEQQSLSTDGCSCTVSAEVLSFLKWEHTSTPGLLGSDFTPQDTQCLFHMLAMQIQDRDAGSSYVGAAGTKDGLRGSCVRSLHTVGMPAPLRAQLLGQRTLPDQVRLGSLHALPQSYLQESCKLTKFCY